MKENENTQENDASAGRGGVEAKGRPESGKNGGAGT